VSEDSRAGWDERDRVLAHRAAALDLRVMERSRALGRGIGAELVERPPQVHRGRARGDEDVVGGVEILAARRGERQPVRRGHADRGRAANGERADGVGDLGRRRAPQLDLLVGQAPLVENDDGVRLEANDVPGL
jgi:hypothetical protein